MKRRFTLFALIPLALLGLCIVGCSDDDDDNNGDPVTPPEPEFYTIGGELTGSDGNVVVTLNGEENIQMVVDGEFTFATEIEDGNDYDVTLTSDPIGQTCTVENGQGSVDGADVTDVAVTCGPNPPGPFTIGGTVSGMGAGELVLQQGSGLDFRTIRNDGEYTFPTAYPDLFTYIVTVSNQPPGPEVCVVLNNRGIIDGADVTNINVVCAVP